MKAELQERNTRWAVRLVIAAMGFNLALSLFAAHVHAVTANEVTACEVAILAAGLPLAWGEFNTDLFCAAGLIAGWLLAVHLIDPKLGEKTFVCLAIPTIYFALGRRWGSPQVADRLVLFVAVVTLAVGVFEMLEPAIYERVLRVLSYYIQKGTVKPSQAHVTGTEFFISGVRPAGEGRSLFPMLGDHRASSIFLEPISLGDFAVIVAMWGMVRHAARPRFANALIAMGAVLAVLADSRLAVGTALAVALVLAMPLFRSKPVLLLMPMVVVAALLYVGFTSGLRPVDDTFGGRVYSSGTLLAGWGPGQWFGVATSTGPIYDCGYAQLISGLGVIPAAVLWAVFALWPANNRLFNRYRSALAVYLCVSLAITGSVLSIKTGALAWFLLGAVEQRTLAAVKRKTPLMAAFRAASTT